MFRYLENYHFLAVPFCFRIKNQQNYLPGLATFTQIYVRNMLSVNPHAVNVLPDTTKTQKQNPNFEVQFLKLHAQYTEKASWFFFFTVIFTQIQYCLKQHHNYCLCHHSALLTYSLSRKFFSYYIMIK